MSETTKEISRQACREWNEKHQVGTEVVVTIHSGRQVVTKTRTAACMVGSLAMVMTFDLTIWYALDRVRPLADVQAEAAEGKVA